MKFYFYKFIPFFDRSKSFDISLFYGAAVKSAY
ncbi:hypothetical protein BB2000_1518 [Proteus mirabilis BB2000]|nr:hypothetical protein BB2000_1518 [Proteus mirabilis BB2000]